MTPQQVFDKVARHLLTQRKRSLKGQGGPCAYRGDDGAACAVGCLMTDDEAKKADAHAMGAVREIAKVGLLPTRLAPHVRLLDALQDVHDMGELHEWADELRELARRRKLRVTVLKEFK